MHRFASNYGKNDRNSLEWRSEFNRVFVFAILLLAIFHPSAIADAAKNITPPTQLIVQGVPPLPESLAKEVAKYTGFSGYEFAAWHPTGNGMLVLHRGPRSSVKQVFMLPEPMAEPRALTTGNDPVSFAAFEPKQAQYLVFGRDRDGDEATQLYRLDLPSGRETQLTEQGKRYYFKSWFNQTSRILYSAVPLDRSGGISSSAPYSTKLIMMDPLAPGASTVMAELSGSGWGMMRLSEDDKTLAMTREISADESEIWMLDRASGKSRRILPESDTDVRSNYHVMKFAPDGSGLFVLTDRFGEFNELTLYEFSSQSLKRITAHIPWDVSGVSITKDGRHLAVRINVNGKEELRLFYGQTFSERERSDANHPLDIPEGSVSQLSFQKQGHLLAFTVNSASSPGQIYVLDADSGGVTQWTRTKAPGKLDTSAFREQQIIRWKSFDGMMISGLISRPPAKFEGKRPVLIQIHGGPAAQAKIGFLGRQQYLIQELGITLIQPNVRGSTGFGKTFTVLDNGSLRENSVRDIGALLEWITEQPDLDASRVMVAGGSYGGYMSLAVAVHYPDRIVGSINSVGISHFVTFLESTERYRRDNRRLEYGDERDLAMRDFLNSISPLTNANKIRKPLYVVQGKNDPRVPWTEAEQIVAAVRANGVPVWYLRGDNEGHSFNRKENIDFEFSSRVLFIREFLLK